MEPANPGKQEARSKGQRQQLWQAPHQTVVSAYSFKRETNQPTQVSLGQNTGCKNEGEQSQLQSLEKSGGAHNWTKTYSATQSSLAGAVDSQTPDARRRPLNHSVLHSSESGRQQIAPGGLRKSLRAFADLDLDPVVSQARGLDRGFERTTTTMRHQFSGNLLKQAALLDAGTSRQSPIADVGRHQAQQQYSRLSRLSGSITRSRDQDLFKDTHSELHQQKKPARVAPKSTKKLPSSNLHTNHKTPAHRGLPHLESKGRRPGLRKKQESTVQLRDVDELIHDLRNRNKAHHLLSNYRLEGGGRRLNRTSVEQMGRWASPVANSGVHAGAELGHGGRQTGDDQVAFEGPPELSVFQAAAIGTTGRAPLQTQYMPGTTGLAAQNNQRVGGLLNQHIAEHGLKRVKELKEQPLRLQQLEFRGAVLTPPSHANKNGSLSKASPVHCPAGSNRQWPTERQEEALHQVTSSTILISKKGTSQAVDALLTDHVGPLAGDSSHRQGEKNLHMQILQVSGLTLGPRGSPGQRRPRSRSRVQEAQSQHQVQAQAAMSRTQELRLGGGDDLSPRIETVTRIPILANTSFGIERTPQIHQSLHCFIQAAESQQCGSRQRSRHAADDSRTHSTCHRKRRQVLLSNSKNHSQATQQLQEDLSHDTISLPYPNARNVVQTSVQSHALNLEPKREELRALGPGGWAITTRIGRQDGLGKSSNHDSLPTVHTRSFQHRQQGASPEGAAGEVGSPSRRVEDIAAFRGKVAPTTSNHKIDTNTGNLKMNDQLLLDGLQRYANEQSAVVAQALDNDDGGLAHSPISGLRQAQYATSKPVLADKHAPTRKRRTQSFHKDKDLEIHVGNLKRIQKQKNHQNATNGRGSPRARAEEVLEQQLCNELQTQHQELAVQLKQEQVASRSKKAFVGDGEAQMHPTEDKPTSVPTTTRVKPAANSQNRRTQLVHGRPFELGLQEYPDSHMVADGNTESGQPTTLRLGTDLSSGPVKSGSIVTDAEPIKQKLQIPQRITEENPAEDKKPSDGSQRVETTPAQERPCKVKTQPRFDDDDLEEWRRHTMTDKLYFLSAASRKNRIALQGKVPDSIKHSRPKIDIGEQGTLGKERKARAQERSLGPEAPSTEGLARAQENDDLAIKLDDLANVTPANKLSSRTPRRQNKAAKKSKLQDQPRSGSPFRIMTSRPLRESNGKLLVKDDHQGAKTKRSGTQMKTKKDQQQPHRSGQYYLAAAPGDGTRRPPASGQERSPASPQRHCYKYHIQTQILQESRNLLDQDESVLNPSPVGSQPGSPKRKARLPKKPAKARMHGRSGEAPNGKKASKQIVGDQEGIEEVRLLPFMEIMNQGRAEGEFEPPEQSEDADLAQDTLYMNSLMAMQQEVLARAGFLLDDEKPDEEFAGSPLGRARAHSMAQTQSDGCRSSLGFSGGMSAARYERLFHEGNNGDQLLRDLMVDVRKNWREGLRAACACLPPWKGPDAPAGPDALTIQPNVKAEPFELKQCEMKYIVIENIYKRPQPINISFKGVRGELLVCLSTQQRFPTESINQEKYLGQTSICFPAATQMQTSDTASQEDNKDNNSRFETQSMPSVFDLRSSTGFQAPRRFTARNLYCTLETTSVSPRVSMSVTFGPQTNKSRQLKGRDGRMSRANSLMQSATSQSSPAGLTRQPSLRSSGGFSACTNNLNGSQDAGDQRELAQGTKTWTRALEVIKEDDIDNYSDDQSDRSPRQSYKHILSLLRQPTSSVLQQHAQLLKEVQNVLSDKDEASAQRLVHQARALQRAMQTQRKQQSQQLYSGQTLDSEASPDQAAEYVDVVAQNVELTANFGEHDLRRRLENLVKQYDRHTSAQAKRAKSLRAFRESAVIFLHRNQIMKMQAERQSEQEYARKKQQRIFMFFFTLMKMKYIVQDKLWLVFKQKSDAWKRQVRRLLAARKIQRELRKYQLKFWSYADIYYPRQHLNRIQCTLRYGMTMAGNLQKSAAETRGKRILVDFFKDAIGMLKMRISAHGYQHAVGSICRRSRDFVLIRTAQHKLLKRMFKKAQKQITQALQSMSIKASQIAGQAAAASEAKSLAVHFKQVPKECRDAALKDYYAACRRSHRQELGQWRLEVLDLGDQGLKDDRLGWRQPFLSQTRAISRFEEVGFPQVAKNTSQDPSQEQRELQPQLAQLAQQCWQHCDQWNSYYLGRSSDAGKRKSRAKSLRKDREQMIRAQKERALKRLQLQQQDEAPQQQDSEAPKIPAQDARILLSLTEDPVEFDSAELLRQQLLEEEQEAAKAQADLEQEQRDFPTRFAPFPDYPQRKYIPTPNLMQHIVFLCVQDALGAAGLLEIFGAEEEIEDEVE